MTFSELADGNWRCWDCGAVVHRAARVTHDLFHTQLKDMDRRIDMASRSARDASREIRKDRSIYRPFEGYR